MKLISLGKIDKKFFLIILLYLTINITNSIISFYFRKNENAQIKNIILIKLLNSFCYIFFGIPEYIMRKKYFKKNKEDKYENNNDKKVLYIYKYPYKHNNYKNLLTLVLMLILLYLSKIGFSLLSSQCSEYLKFDSEEYFIIIYLLYLYLIYRIILKTIFYRHENLSLIILIISGLIMVIFQIFYVKKVKFSFPGDLLNLIAIFIYPIFTTLTYYFQKQYMEYKYYSPYFICFLTGLIYITISIIILCVFLNINLDDNSVFHQLTWKDDISNGYILVLYLIRSFCYAFNSFIQMKIIDDFTIFYIFILIAFDEFIVNIMKIEDFDSIELIVSIIIFILKMFAILVFVEIIELNFCGLNTNLKKNIIDRGINEINLIYDISDNSTNENDNSYNNIQADTINNNNRHFSTNTIY